jgi:putative ABC transport system permease protein
VVAASQDYPDVISLDIATGRFFTAPESNAGRAVAVLGHQVAIQLFGRADCLGQTLKVRGTKLEVVGVFAEQGQSLISSGFDESMMVPSTFAPRIFDVAGDGGSQISIKARPEVDMDALKSELIQQFRAVRRVRPGRENDFAVNHMDFVATLLDGVFDNLEKGGWFIAMFAILVGCFSIANIMFVSVRERTKIIGVQKAIGAKNTFILIQFLFEAVTLCVFGSLLALVCIQLLIWGINATDFGLTLHIAPKRVILALGVAVTSGLVAGMAPARQAANLPPVEAMRTH